LLELAKSVPDLVTDSTFQASIESARREAAAAKAFFELAIKTSSVPTLTPEGIERLSNKMTSTLTGEKPRAKLALRSIVDCVEVDQTQIRIIGESDQLFANFNDRQDGSDEEEPATPKTRGTGVPRVRGYVDGWLRGQATISNCFSKPKRSRQRPTRRR
jgi:hypothetical protein